MATSNTTSSVPANNSISQTHNGNSSSNTAASNNNNRLNFNRLAAERKTVHVMNINKDTNKRERQLLGGITPNLSSNHNNYSALTGTIHTHHNINGPSSTLNSHNGGGNRNQTNQSGSFLQKLSSKFTRR